MQPGQEPYDTETPYAWADPPPPRRPLARTLAAAGLLVVVLAVLGGPLGALWHVLAPTVPVVNAGDGQILINDQSPEEYIAADGWFAIIGLVFGLLAAVAAWLLLRRYRGPWLVAAVTLGSLAAAVVAWQAGRLIGLGAYEDWQRTSVLRDTYQAPPDIHAFGVLLVPAFAAAIVLTLAAGWSNDPNLDEPGARPGYGHDLPTGPPPHLDPSAPHDHPSYPGYPGYQGYPGSPGGSDPQTYPSPPGEGGGTGPQAYPSPPGEGGASGPQAYPGSPGGGPAVSSGWPDGQDPTAAPGPRGPGPAGPPHG